MLTLLLSVQVFSQMTNYRGQTSAFVLKLVTRRGDEEIIGGPSL